MKHVYSHLSEKQDHLFEVDHDEIIQIIKLHFNKKLIERGLVPAGDQLMEVKVFGLDDQNLDCSISYTVGSTRPITNPFEETND